MSRLFTGCFFDSKVARPSAARVGITFSPPTQLAYELDGNLRELAPDGWMLRLPKERFEPEYVSKLSRLGVDGVQALLAPFQGRDVILLCYERLPADRPEVWCQRRLLADWWRMKTGEVVEEL